MSIETPAGDLHRLTANIVAAHIARNAVPADGLSDLIRSVYVTLSAVATPAAPPPEVRQQPAVPVKKSVFPGYIVCLEDGKKLLMLKRHLQVAYGLTPDAYRIKWDLPVDYPMVAPDYAARRSTLAKELGLGRKPDPVAAPAPIVKAAAAEPEVPDIVMQRIPASKRGRKPGSKNRSHHLVDTAAQ